MGNRWVDALPDDRRVAVSVDALADDQDSEAVELQGHAGACPPETLRGRTAYSTVLVGTEHSGN